MSLFSLVLGLLGAVVVALLFFGMVGRRVMQAQGVAAPVSRTPDRVTLVPRLVEPHPGMAARTTAFETLGYQRVGIFDVPEMPGVQVTGLVDASTNTYGIVYAHPRAGTWSDVVLYYADDTSLTVSSTPQGGKLDPRPGCQKAYAKGGSEQDLVKLTAATRVPDKAARPAAAALFVAEFERDYAEEMAWRQARGGVTRQELQRIAQAMPTPLSQDTVERASAVMHAQAVQKSTQQCRDAFARSMEPAAWEAVAARVVVVLDFMTATEAAAAVEGSLAHPTLVDRPALEERFQMLARQLASPFVWLERAQELLPPAARWTVAKELETPARAWILLLPAA